MIDALERPARLGLLATTCLGLAACGEQAQVPIEKTFGPNPVLAQPNPTFLPTVTIADAVGWPEGGTPTAAAGLTVAAFADGLDHPRWLYRLPNGDILVAESNGPSSDYSAGDQGLYQRAKNIVAGWFKSNAGAGVESPNRITLLRDADGDGTAEVKEEFMTDLFSPFGMTLVGDRLYIANADALVSVPYQEGQTEITATPEKVVDLPGGPINHHWTKNVIASPDGSRLYVTVGSNSNVGENGLDHEINRAAILEVDPVAKTSRLFAGGLRNPNGMGWNPETGELWTVVNERDEIGSDLVPDYMTSVQDGGFYGWPYSYYGQVVDERVEPMDLDLVEQAIKPDYALGPHTASLGLAFAEGELMPEAMRNGVFIGQHGSWNRQPPAGYEVIFVPFTNGEPSGPPVDVLSGFLNDAGEAQGRPVGVTFDRAGALLVADDVGNVVWRVAPSGNQTASN
ncbi:PQQ-dependent sugar dehydrogenase [Marinivivus vitaminiproducens]|uniref:PQQ-dependent sugar dehydrogenase n=1 Tax=Marinivivus vitaminiproducens TaxID=3035935 RepID=UPI00279F8A93|nr:sorbosone dehydrogenase family protein [Geminicoccaceae bacterium SCSIO 64248]